MRVFVCDDEAEYRSLLRAVLTPEEGLEIVGEAGDAASCLADIGQAGPDVLLLDVNMPGMDGITAVPLLRDAAPDTTILMLTSAGPELGEARALAAGATGYIQKPTSIFDLPGLIRDHMPS